MKKDQNELMSELWRDTSEKLVPLWVAAAFLVAIAVFFAVSDYHVGQLSIKPFAWAMIAGIVTIFLMPIFILLPMLMFHLMTLVWALQKTLGKINLRVDMDILKASLDLEEKHGIDYFSLEAKVEEKEKMRKYMNDLFGTKDE